MSNCTISAELQSVSNAMRYVVYRILLPSYMFTGLISNTTLLIAFYKQSKTESTYIYQVLLTIGKMLEVFWFGGFLVSAHYFSGRVYPHPGVEWFKKSCVATYLSLSVGLVFHIHFIIASLLLAVAMSADRVYALSLPIPYQTRNEKRGVAITAIACFGIPSLASLWLFACMNIYPNGEFCGVEVNEWFVGSFAQKASAYFTVIIRFASMGTLFVLNVLSMYFFRKRMVNVAVISQEPQRLKARKELNKALQILTIWQSVLMFVNQFPHMCMHATIFISTNTFVCYQTSLIAPAADAFIFLTDSFDLPMLMLLNRKMRTMVKQIFPWFKQQQAAVNPLQKNVGK